MKILFFGAIWCKDCNVMRPLWRSMKLENPNLEVQYFDVDKHKKYCKTFNIIDVPTVIFIDKKGKELERCSGIKHREFIIDLIKKYKNL